MVCNFKKYILHFRNPAGTSRGVLHSKETYILHLSDGEKTAFGECNLFRGLSFDDRSGYEEKLKDVCDRLPKESYDILSELVEWPSIRFGVETVLNDWEQGCRKIIFDNENIENGFSIPINALIWMGTKEEMLRRIDEKLKQGYKCIKLKIGAIDFEIEIGLIQYIRNHFSASDTAIRLDANGAFTPQEATKKLDRLSAFDIEYIEQPVKAGQWPELAAIKQISPIPIALDEELIGINNMEKKKELMNFLSPEILILKPALLGGFDSCDEWRSLLVKYSGSYIITSALESNIGLNAIAQYCALNRVTRPQGLGTGQLYISNFVAPYTTDATGLHFDPAGNWDFNRLQ